MQTTPGLKELPDVVTTLDDLAAEAKTKWPFNQFEDGLLDSEDEEGRWQILMLR